MTPPATDLKPLHDAIRRCDLMNSWADGLFVGTTDEGKQRAEEKRQEADQAYIRMMKSAKNHGSAGYRDWAIGKALGIDLAGTKTDYRTRASNRRRNKGLS